LNETCYIIFLIALLVLLISQFCDFEPSKFILTRVILNHLILIVRFWPIVYPIFLFLSPAKILTNHETFF